MAAEARKTGDQALPKRIGRYEAFLQIGAGGMARVYLAVQRGLAGQKAELVVVKILRPEVIEDEHVLALFTDEARIAMRLEHPNVIRTREVIAGPPDYLLAMDFQDGRSLLEVVSRLGREAVPLDDHIHVLSKVLAGLGYAHELTDENGGPFGIVHRDVSPANVLVTYTGEVKLLDFGIAKATGALAATRDGVVKGKLGYAAPEQCLGQPADPRSDIYAVGVMLWEAIARRRRVSGETWQSVLQARLDDSEPALEEVCPDAPKALMAIVRKGVARDPNDRYPTAREFQTDLETYLTKKRGQAMDPRRIAAMLKPHFDQDRADMRRSIETFLKTLKRGKTAPVGRMPLPGGRAAAPAPEAAAAVRLEESTAPIPVDAALLLLSRGESAAGPASPTPTAPPPAPFTKTAPPPPDVVVTPRAEAVLARSSSAETPPLREKTAGPARDAPASATAPASVAMPPKAFPAAVDAYGLVAVAKPVAVLEWPSGTALPALPQKKTKAWPFLLLGVGAIGLVGIVLVLRLEGPTEHAAAPPAPAAVSEAAHSAATSSARKVDEVKVRISVDPADALVELDGRTLSGNPFVATLPRDNVDHVLTASAEGCKDQKQIVHLNGDLAVLVAMKCQRQGLRLSGRPIVRRPMAAAATSPPPEAAATPTPALQPGGALEPANEPQAPRAMPDDNPYK
ncbi:MAG TPA: serine/threonine-protein kinase [Polyangiaceae bacterium]